MAIRIRVYPQGPRIAYAHTPRFAFDPYQVRARRVRARRRARHIHRLRQMQMLQAIRLRESRLFGLGRLGGFGNAWLGGSAFGSRYGGFGGFGDPFYSASTGLGVSRWPLFGGISSWAGAGLVGAPFGRYASRHSYQRVQQTMPFAQPAQRWFGANC